MPESKSVKKCKEAQAAPKLPPSITCPRESLLAAIDLALSAVPRRTTKDILKNILLRVSGGRAELVSTDGEIGMHVDLTESIACGDGSILLPANMTKRIVELMPECVVAIESGGSSSSPSDQSRVLISCEGSRFSLPVDDPADFPPVATFEDEEYFVVKASTLKQLIHRTIFATDTESTRYALGGVQIELTPERATFAATDSRRLAVVSADCTVVGKTEFFSGVIPAKAMRLIDSACDDSCAKIALSDKGASVQFQNVIITSPFIQGKFPDWQKIVPAAFDGTIKLDTEQFHQLVKRSLIVTNEECRGVEFSFFNGEAKATIETAERGSSVLTMPVAYSGPVLCALFDARYLDDWLESVAGEKSALIHWLADSELIQLQVGQSKCIVKQVSRD